MTLPKLRSLIANYCGKTAAELLVTDGVTQVNLVDEAINAAKRHLQSQHDFEACRTIGRIGFTASSNPTLNTAALSEMEAVPLIATGSVWTDVGEVGSINSTVIIMTLLDRNLTAGQIVRIDSEPLIEYTVQTNATAGAGAEVNVLPEVEGFPDGQLELEEDINTTIEVKRIEHAYWSDSFIPIEFMSREQYNARVRQFTGHSLTNTYTPDLAIVVQHGEKLQLFEGNATVTVDDEFYFDVVRFLPDYDGSITDDWFLDNAWEFLQWQGIVEVNKYTKEFVPIEEANLDEPTQKALDAMTAAIARDMAYKGSTPPRQPFTYPQSKINAPRKRN